MKLAARDSRERQKHKYLQNKQGWQKLFYRVSCLTLTGLSAGSFSLAQQVRAAPESLTQKKTGKVSSPPNKSLRQKRRVISLAPSNTELLCELGAGDELVGVCTFCDYPDVQTLSRVGTFVSANLERLARLKPDLIVLVSGQERLKSMLEHNNFHCVVLPNNHLSDITNNINSLGQLTGKESEAQRLSLQFASALSDFKALVKKANSRPKVFYCVWPQPLITVGKESFLDEIITTCGGINAAGELSAAYPHFSQEKLLLADPDILIMPYEARNQKFLTTAPWAKLRAVKEKRVFFLPAPKDDLLARPTTRILGGLTWLSKKLHPELSKELSDWQAGNASKKQDSIILH